MDLIDLLHVLDDSQLEKLSEAISDIKGMSDNDTTYNLLNEWLIEIQKFV